MRTATITRKTKETDINLTICLDGGEVKLLNKGDFFHESQIDDACRYFVDNFSRVDAIPETALYDCLGNKIMTLETSDFSRLLANGYKFPRHSRLRLPMA